MNPSFAGRYSSSFSSPKSGTFDFESLISKLPQEQQEKARIKLIESQIEAQATNQAISPLFQQPYSLEELGRFREDEARRAQELGKESVQEAFKYSTLAKLPKQISEGFGNQAMLTVLGARSAVDAMNQTLASYPQMSFAMTPFRAEKYLG
jgi:hypothetical protein